MKYFYNQIEIVDADDDDDDIEMFYNAMDCVMLRCHPYTIGSCLHWKVKKIIEKKILDGWNRVLRMNFSLFFK